MTIFSSVVKENCKNEKLFEIEMNNTAKHKYAQYNSGYQNTWIV